MSRLSNRIACVLFLALAVLCSVASPGRAFAQPTAAEAAGLKAKADEAMLNLQYQEAFDLYEKAYALSKDPALHYNRGRALAALNRFPEALQMFEAFERDAPATLKAKVPDLADFVNQIRQKVATITIQVVPSGATIRLGDVVLGQAPLDKRQVNAGKTKVVITAEGYAPLEQEVDLPGGKETTLDLKLTPKDRRGTLVVKSVTGALVKVDGKPAGHVPTEIRLDPGTHEIVLDHPDYYASSSKVVVGVGERKEVDLPLEEVPAVYETWWFWTIIGGVAVTGGAIGVGVALTTERGPDEGSIDPGSIVIRPERAPDPGFGVSASRSSVSGRSHGAVMLQWAWSL